MSSMGINDRHKEMLKVRRMLTDMLIKVMVLHDDVASKVIGNFEN